MIANNIADILIKSLTKEIPNNITDILVNSITNEIANRDSWY